MSPKRKVSGEVVEVEVGKKVEKPPTPAAKRALYIKKLRKENDLIWSAIVKMNAECVSEKVPTERELIDHPSRQLNSHHYFRKEMYPWMRWDVRNGLCVYSWQHVRARGSAHDDPARFDAFAVPYLRERGDYGYLLGETARPQKITPMLIEETNANLRDMFYETSGSVWGE
jgi:hypothetical protein